jgi:hypothetical protein
MIFHGIQYLECVLDNQPSEHLAIPSTSKTKLPPLGRFALANLPSGSVFAGNLLESNYRDVCVADIWMKPSFLKLFLNHGYETN